MCRHMARPLRGWAGLASQGTTDPGRTAELIHYAIGYSTLYIESTPTLRVGPPGRGTDCVLGPGGAVAVRHLGAEMCRCYHGHVGVLLMFAGHGTTVDDEWRND